MKTSSDAPTWIDPFGRSIEYLRLSVTDRCDLRCGYCMPKKYTGFKEPSEWLTFDEIERLVRALARGGLRKVRLTGGEPLLRRNLTDLASRLSAVPGIVDLSLSTNATRLAGMASELKRSGVSRLNVSLDSLKPERVEAICGQNVLPKVLDGLQAAKAAGFAPIKINTVAMAGVNEDEIDDIVDYCDSQAFTLRLIEVMPMGDSGRNAQYLDLQGVRRRLQRRFGLVDGVVPGGGPARYLCRPSDGFSIGFITPMSQHFCATCNRVRLAVDGTMYMCLGHEDRYEFRALLRGNAGDAAIQQAVRQAILRKPERHEFRESPHKVLRFMSATGG
ncbi:GTP 3',8-cyclase MoaA [Variovorax sp. LjRoot178]|uniref:GTP 3',8-cyclase MoaA n=1 Tax=Variovorax sp. LjRoot178 TaxID=3342277 RepID=UPI003ED07DA8